MPDGLIMHHTLEAFPKVNGQRTIAIGTVTRKRPQMLKRLLQSYACLRVPEDIRLLFIVVENNETATITPTIELFRSQVPGSFVHYEVETRLGIASARNRVLESALNFGCELLTFADDDETVEPDWLTQLLLERDRLDLDIVGSPVRLAPIDTSSSLWERFVWAGMDRQNRACEAKCVRNRSLGKPDRIRIATGSWMGRLDFFRHSGLRFDVELGLAGGEDWRLWEAARQRGAVTGWTPLAVAFETIPRERLTMTYQFKRNKDHCLTEFRSKLEKRPKGTILRLPGSLAGRLLSFGFYIVAAPLTRGRTLVRAMSCLGAVAGILGACIGRSAAHYKAVNGG